MEAFIESALKVKGLDPAPKAGRRTLIPRLMLDMTGLIPFPEEAEAFINDQTPDANKRLVDLLLGSHNLGERWARFWIEWRLADVHRHDNAEIPA